MKHKKIYLIRHGETDFNKLGIVQGSGVDTDLNDEGRRQAGAFHRHYGHLLFDRIYTSTLKRSIQSVQPFETASLKSEPLAGLNEINWGNREGEKISMRENAYYLSILKRWNEGEVDAPLEGGESPLDVQKRIRPALNGILEDHSAENLLICMHGRAMRILLCTLLHYPLHMMDIFQHRNMGLYVITYTGSFGRIDVYNDSKHLLDEN